MSDANLEKDIFLAVLDRATPAEQSTFLEQACAGDDTLRQRIERLLSAHHQPDSVLDQPAVGAEDTEEAVSDTRPRTVAFATAITASDMGQRLADNAGATPGETAVDDQALTFLAPAQEAGSLGRLDHYEVLQVLGRGGMGVVLKAHDTKLQRIVAVKVLAAQLAASGNARKRFAREARAAAAVRDEHVVGIHAVHDEGALPYLVMEYVSGNTLDERIKQGGALDIAEIASIGLQLARGLAVAHAQGLIHRDIKPGNILLEPPVPATPPPPGGLRAGVRVKIGDFGLARAADDVSLTQSGVIAGTPLYMSPEQAEGTAIDHRSDLFSLGSVLYTLCTAQPPFRADNTMAVLRRVREEKPRPVQELNPDVPDWLAAVVDRLLAKDPTERFQTAEELAELLEAHLANGQPTGRSLSRPLQVAQTGEQDAHRSAASKGKHAPRQRRFLIAAGLVSAAALVLLSWGGLFNWGRGSYELVGVLAYRPSPDHPGLPAPKGLETHRKLLETNRDYYEELKRRFKLDMPADALAKTFKVRALPEGSALQLQLRWPDKEVGAKLVNTLMELHCAAEAESRKKYLQKAIQAAEADTKRWTSALGMARAELKTWLQKRKFSVNDAKEALKAHRQAIQVAERTVLESKTTLGVYAHEQGMLETELVNLGRDLKKSKIEPVVDPGLSGPLKEKDLELEQQLLLLKESLRKNLQQRAVALDDYERRKGLFEKGVITAVEWKSVVNRLEDMKALVKLDEQRIALVEQQRRNLRPGVADRQTALAAKKSALTALLQRQQKERRKLTTEQERLQQLLKDDKSERVFQEWESLNSKVEAVQRQLVLLEAQREYLSRCLARIDAELFIRQRATPSPAPLDPEK